MYPKMALCLVVHHSGFWISDDALVYVGGLVTVFDKLPSEINPQYIRKMIYGLGYKNVVKMHYLDPTKDLQTGLRFLGTDDATFDTLIGCLHEFSEVHIYTEHDDNVDEEPIIDLANEHVGSFVDLLNSCVQEGEECNGDCLERNVVIETSVDPLVGYDPEASDNEDDEVINARVEIKKDELAQKAYEEELASLQRVAERSTQTNISGTDGVDVESEYEGSSDLDSPSEDTDEEDCGYLENPGTSKRLRKRNLAFRVGTGPKDTTFFVGQTFDNALQFKAALTNYSVNHGKDIKITKNCRDRVGASCKTEGCDWYIWASWSEKSTTFKVKTYRGEHRCDRVDKVKMVTSSWIADHYHKQFKVNPYMKLQEIVGTIWSDWGLRTTIWMSSKARKKAQSLIVGEYKEQYGLLSRYAAEILKVNPNNTVKFGLEENVFKRMYICFEELRLGFVNGCRPFISIDGCFLKGPFGGQLLVAVGRDGNNQMYPIAWALVEVESESSWSWFLELLGSDLGTIDGSGYTVMPDQQKGLLNAVANVWLAAEQRCCARHVYCNFREVFGGGQDFRRGFWRIAKSSTLNEFNENVAKFRQLSDVAADYLLKRNYKRWSRAFFTCQSMCDNVDNNMSEVFNAYILAFRHKPIITMLDEMATIIMDRHHKKRDYMNNRDLFLCPRIAQKLEKAKYDARGWSATWDGSFKYAIREGVSQLKYVVDLLNRTCSCNVWQLNGIPCHHAVSAIWMRKGHPEHYVAECYHKTGFLKAYQWTMQPLNGPQEWPQSSCPPILPPPLKTLKAGRPKKKRRLQSGEVTAKGKLSKQGIKMRCSRCKSDEHNVRKCPLTPPADQVMPKKPKRSKKVADATTTVKEASKTSHSTPPKRVTKQHQQLPPMHDRGFGLYTYPDGYQRAGTMGKLQPRRAAYYTDVDGHQALHSISSMRTHHVPFVQSQSSSNNTTNSIISLQRRSYICSQALENSANNTRRE